MRSSILEKHGSTDIGLIATLIATLYSHYCPQTYKSERPVLFLSHLVKHLFQLKD